MSGDVLKHRSSNSVHCGHSGALSELKPARTVDEPNCAGPIRRLAASAAQLGRACWSSASLLGPCSRSRAVLAARTGQRPFSRRVSACFGGGLYRRPSKLPASVVDSTAMYRVSGPCILFLSTPQFTQASLKSTPPCYSVGLARGTPRGML